MRACSGGELRTDGQRSGGAGLAVHGGREGRRWVSQRKVGGEWLIEKGGTLSPCAVVGRQGSWPPPIYTRWWATLPNAKGV